MAGCFTTEKPSATSEITAQPPTDSTIETSVEKKPSNVSADPKILALINSSNRTQYAQENGITYYNKRVGVIAITTNNSSVVSKYNATITQTTTASARTLVQASIHVDDIIPMSNEPDVEYIRLPRAPVSTSPQE
jgi:hypothetical protein